ncbi:imidazole glycerol phosphate synthase subunit HisH [Pelagibacterium xiamenense]|uniref:imidazole glycerol phosphate synthase subunit HisH n=1 Tax=Pelagibacterium xiamenense TaxID=2901140 RepID=UPI001E4939FA|nr:imidazole glycerol phosphate synthase subunit HisH [Pelagibacterium xiamenense]MCD7058443.1 imidazole glycerol phosphate synthase subunit HisH [Pelagibacterium xiamenense]
MSGTVAIIDYGAGNLKSAQKAFARAAEGSGTDVLVTAEADAVRKADRIVLPGVGAFADCMAGLEAVPGMRDVLEERVLGRGVPFFGICVGMQLLASVGREKVEVAGLDWISGAVEKIEPQDPRLKVPHMGWNTLTLTRAHPLFDGIATGEDGLHAYFVHSYHFAVENPDDRIATADYGGPITAAVGRNNVFGTQFHPEKSQTLGLALIANFLTWSP